MEHLSKTNYVSANLLLERKQRISRCHDVSGKELCSAAQKNDKDKEENCWNLRNKQGKASEERKKREGSDWKEKISRTDVEGRRDEQQMDMEETKISHFGEKRNNKRQNEEESISSSVQTSGVPGCQRYPYSAPGVLPSLRQRNSLKRFHFLYRRLPKLP